MNGLSLLAMIALSVGVVVAYRAGWLRGRREAGVPAPHPLAAPAVGPAARPASPQPADAAAPPSPAPALPPTSDAPARESASPPAGDGAMHERLDDERARIIRAGEREGAALRAHMAAHDAERAQLRELAEERRALFVALADSRAETARYRQLVVDVEDNAPSRFLDGPGSADDLKLIVGVGPMLERMLHQLGVTTYRQIARWSERDVDEFDRRLPEFHGRIRRDAWVTQARALHQSKYGSAP